MSSRQNNQYPVVAHHQPRPDGATAPTAATMSTMSTPLMNQYPNGQPQQPQQHHYGAPADPLTPFVGKKNGRMYRLSVVQQPIRARMCGFGDKDRRPITPPPCVRLEVLDANTMKEIEYGDVDSTFYVLSVDLWDAEGGREVNLVKHANGTPAVSISNSIPVSYPPIPDRPIYMLQHLDGYGRPVAVPQPPSYPNAPQVQPHIVQTYYGGAGVAAANYTPTYGAPHGYVGGVQVSQHIAMPPPHLAAAPQSMFTRNLIGSLSVNSNRLQDTNQKDGFWFVLQDLSVRTEGTFRLKMSFVDVGSGLNNNTLNQGRAPVLATCFSNTFQVFSAKKFPGVIESTALSKAFANQGIKIPIRKDGLKPINNQEEYDNDD